MSAAASLAFGTAPGGYPWSPYNLAIFEAIADHDANAPHVAVRARAGSGKTTSGVHALGLTSQSDRVIACAFNSDIAKTLAERVPEWVDARTFHSVGNGAVWSSLGKTTVDKDKVRNMARELCPQEARQQPSYITALCRVVSLAKNTLSPQSPIAMGKLADRYQIDGAPEAWTPARDEFNQRALTLLLRCAKFNGVIDFDDMVWLPVHLNLPVRPWDFVLADEAQDLNACQHALVKKLVGRRGRLLAIGDDRQAIYQFRGAAEGSFDSLANHFEADILPLSVCYRCDASIVAHAATVVPDFEARPGAPDGIVREATTDQMLDSCAPGDFILSRSKAPLMGHCLALLGDGKPATIVGRDIAGGLIGLIKKSKAASVEALTRWLNDHQTKAAERLAVEDPESYEEIADRCECLRVVARETPSIGATIDKIDRLFSEGAGRGTVRLSTTHKAKGLETDRVWMLADTYRKRPGIAEENLWYVAVTRAKHELVEVYAEQQEPDGDPFNDDQDPSRDGNPGEQ